MSVLNETPAIDIPQVWIGSHRLLFEGHLNDLDWHRHSFVCVLLGMDSPITLVTNDGQTRTGSVVVVPGNTDHQLRFEGGRVLSHYIGPHDADYAALMGTSDQSGDVLDMSAGWTDAIEGWLSTRDPRGLINIIRSTWIDEECILDHRITQITKMLWRGEGLREGTTWFAAQVNLSPSRLSFLCKRETHGTLGELQRGYRFWHAARAMLDARTFTEAAHASEFADAAHFSRAFRAAYGLAPSKILLTQTRWMECDVL